MPTTFFHVAPLSVGGLALGAIVATVMARMLIEVLTGVFDPPPSSTAVPWGYLAGLAALTIATTAAAAAGAVAWLLKSTPEEVRDL